MEKKRINRRSGNFVDRIISETISDNVKRLDNAAREDKRLDEMVSRGIKRALREHSMDGVRRSAEHHVNEAFKKVLGEHNRK